MVLENISFRVTLIDSGYYYYSIWLTPEQYLGVLNQFALEYHTSMAITQLIENLYFLKSLSDHSREKITSNEFHIYMSEADLVTFDTEFVSGIAAITIPFEDSIDLLNQYRTWLEKCEKCQIVKLVGIFMSQL